MITISDKIPFYAKASLLFVGLTSLIFFLFIAQQIVVPIIYSAMLAILLTPLVDFLVRRKMNRVVAITITLGLVFSGTAVVMLLVYSQLSLFTESYPTLVNNFYELIHNLVNWTSAHFNISTERINQFLATTKMEIGSSSMISSTIASMSQMIIIPILIPVYVFMLLYYQPHLLDFIRQLFNKANHKEVNEVLTSTKGIIQKYLVALLLEALIMATLNSIGLLIIGIEYAILLGVMGALLNIIPFIGGVFSTALPLLVVFATSSNYTDAVWVVIVYVIIQFIDNHYIFPKIVGSKVRLNALVSIVVVLAFRALWGVPGMFLSIPLTAILKVVCDHIESLKPWGFLLGDNSPPLLIKMPKKFIEKNQRVES